MKSDKKRVLDHKCKTGRLLIGILFFLFIIQETEIITKADTTYPEKLGELHAISAVLMDADSGRVLVGKNSSEVRAMASTTKIMTCILALENGKMDDIVTVSKEAASQPAVHLKMQEGQQFYLKDLLYSLMLESHNDTAYAIAEHVGGSVEGFASMMNEKAKEIGCVSTYYITPNGLDAEDANGTHRTTAEELAMVMRYCIQLSPQKDAFLEITGTNSYQFQDVEKKSLYDVQNQNAFLNMMEGALSGKTGYTGTAGYCYVGALRRDDRTFIVALLGSGWPNQKDYKWQDTRALMEYALNSYTYQEVPIVSDLQPVEVLNGTTKESLLFEKILLPIRINTEETSMMILSSAQEEIRAEIQRKETMEAPVEQGEVVGKITYYIDDLAVKEYEIVSADSIEKIQYKDYVIKTILRFLKLTDFAMLY